MEFTSLFRKGIVIVSVKTTQLGTSKRLSESAKTEIAAANGMKADRLNATKVIAKSDNLKAIGSEKTAFNSWIKEHAVPAAEFIRSGCYFIDRTLLPELEQVHAQATANIDGYLQALQDEWSLVREASKNDLGPEWSEDLLPTDAAQLAGEFSLTYSVFEISIPENMDPEQHQRELDKANNGLKSAFREIEITLRDEMIATGTNAGLLVALKRRLDSFGKGKDGTGKGDRFRIALLTNISDWCERVPTRNISENAMIAQLADIVSEDVSKWDAEVFRDSEDARLKASERVAYLIRQFDSI